METKENISQSAERGARRWFGSAACVVLCVFLAGRLALEPVRTLPQYDAKGMEAYAAVETFAVRQDPEPIKLAMFGSSVSIWGVLPDLVAEGLQMPKENVRKLAVVGGTAFDHWNLIRRNLEKFQDMRTAVIEINPRMLSPDMESDERVRFTISQHASWAERKELHHGLERDWQQAEMALPLVSVRRSLRSAFLNILQPGHGSRIYPKPDARLHPFFDWRVNPDSPPVYRDIVPPNISARRLVGNWKYSKLQDQCLRQMLAWLRERDVRIVLYQMPVHPGVAQHVRDIPAYAAGYAKFNAYVASLGVEPHDFIQTLDIADCDVPVEGLRDGTHLNQIGATSYSRWFGGSLRALLQASGQSNEG